MLIRGDNRACKIINEAGAINVASAFFIVKNTSFKVGDKSPCCVIDAPDDLMSIFRENGIKIGDDIGRNKPSRVERQRAEEKALKAKLKDKNGADGAPVVGLAPCPPGNCLVRVVPFDYHRSGLWVFVREMLEWTAASGIETHLVCKGEHGSVADIPGVKIHYCDKADEAEKVVRELNPALIHTHSIAKTWGIPPDFDKARLVGTEHGSFDNNVKPQQPWAVSIVGRPDSVWHGVDLEQFHPPKRRRRGKMLRVGISGRIDATKLPDSFLKMLRDAPLKGVQWTILGGLMGSERSNVSDALRAIPGLNVKGWVDRVDMPNELRKLDVLCVPSSMEPFGRQLTEAMACGVPVVARNTQGPGAIVGEGGILCSDDGVILEAIQLFRDDKPRWLAMCKKARSWAEKKFDKKRVEADYQRIYKERSGGALRFGLAWAGIATLPGREGTLKIAVESLLHQVDHIHVALNGHSEVPACLKHPKITYTRNAENKGAREKYRILDGFRGYYFSCDDDNQYPPDYVARMVELIERHDRNVHAGVMGSYVYPPVQNWQKDHSTICANAASEEIEVDQVGTGAAAFHTDILGGEIPYKFIDVENRCDICFSRFCVENDIKRVLVGREADWFKCLHNKSEMSKIYDAEKHETTTRIARGIWPKAKSTAVVYFGNMGIGNYIMSTPLLPMIENPECFIVEGEKWIDEIISIFPERLNIISVAEIEELFAKHEAVIFPFGTPVQYRKRNGKKRRMEIWTNGEGRRHEVFSYTGIMDPEAEPGNTYIKTQTCHPWKWAKKGSLKIALSNGANPAKAWAGKRWPMGNWTALIELIGVYYDASFLFLGGKSDRTDGDSLLRENLRNMAGALTFAESAEACRQADLLISTDTGIMHAADAVGTPCVAMFGFTLPEKNRPWNNSKYIIQSDGNGCPHFPCFQKSDQGKCDGHSCMAQITPDMVFAKVKEALDETP